MPNEKYPDKAFLKSSKKRAEKHIRVLEGGGRDAKEEQPAVGQFIATLRKQADLRPSISHELKDIIDHLEMF